MSRNYITINTKLEWGKKNTKITLFLLILLNKRL